MYRTVTELLNYCNLHSQLMNVYRNCSVIYHHYVNNNKNNDNSARVKLYVIKNRYHCNKTISKNNNNNSNYKNNINYNVKISIHIIVSIKQIIVIITRLANYHCTCYNNDITSYLRR